jgi:aryl carrier-like protein
MHDAKDLDKSLGRLRAVLAPGGASVLVEGTVNSRLQLVTFGFLEWLSDAQGRRADPFLSVAKWRERLTAAGFTGFTAIPGPAEEDQGDQHVMLSQRLAGPAPLEPAGLRETLAEALPAYMVPHHYLQVDRIPLSANGKVDASQLPDPWVAAATEERVAPRDETERTLHALWCDALGHGDFGVRDDFFQIGGDSLHAIHLLGRLPDALAAGIAEDALRVLLDNPTIEGWAIALHDRKEFRDREEGAPMNGIDND